MVGGLCVVVLAAAVMSGAFVGTRGVLALVGVCGVVGGVGMWLERDVVVGVAGVVGGLGLVVVGVLLFADSVGAGVACCLGGVAGVASAAGKLTDRLSGVLGVAGGLGGPAALVAGGVVSAVAGERVLGAGLVLAGVALFVSFRSEG